MPGTRFMWWRRAIVGSLDTDLGGIILQKKHDDIGKLAARAFEAAREDPLGPVSSAFWSAKEESDTLNDIINADINRTFSDHPFFTSEECRGSMQIILHTWAEMNPRVSYKQGMNELLAPALMLARVEKNLMCHRKSRFIEGCSLLLCDTLNSKIKSWPGWSESEMLHGAKCMAGWLQKPNFKDPQRILVGGEHSSPLRFMTTNALNFAKKWTVGELKKRYFKILVNEGMLLYFSSDSPGLAPLGGIDLKSIVHIRAGTAGAHVFELLTVDRSYTLVAASPRDMYSWICSLCTVCSRVGPNVVLNKYHGFIEEFNDTAIFTWFSHLLNDKRNSSVGQVTVADLFLHSNHRSSDLALRRDASAFPGVYNGNENDPENLPVRRLCRHFFHVLLSTIDCELYSFLRNLEVEPQLFALRWFRCLFSTVFACDDLENRDKMDASFLYPLMAIWDKLFLAKERLLDLVESIALVMVVSIRQRLLQSDINGVLMSLMKWSKPEGVTDIMSWVHLLISTAEMVINSPGWPNNPSVSYISILVGVGVELGPNMAKKALQQVEHSANDVGERQNSMKGAVEMETTL